MLRHMVNAVAAAAQRTLASESARVRQRTFVHQPNPALERMETVREGVADLARRRTRVQQRGPSMIDDFARRLVARYPWLDDDEDGEEPGDPAPLLFAGTTSFMRMGDSWREIGDGDPYALWRRPNDPLWIVEALRYAEETVDRGTADVHGAECRRWEFRVDPAGRPDLQAGRRTRPLRVAGDAFIDEEGRIRRATWTTLRRGRPRSPGAGKPRPQFWDMTELWAFGIPVRIDLPDAQPLEPSPPLPIALFQAAGVLWRRKRAYERRHGMA
jgi:hypothetical protein